MQAPFNSQLSALIVAASNAPVYTRRSLLGVDGPQTPGASAQPRPMHKPPVASAGLSILGREGPPGGPPLGERTTAAGSTTARLRVVSKCALRRGLAKRMERPSHPRTLPLGFLLLVDHRLFSLCHSATNEPPANVYLGGETTLYTIHLNTDLGFSAMLYQKGEGNALQKGKTKAIAVQGVLFALMSALSFAEGFLTPWLGLPPGVKIGLANTVVMYALLCLGKGSAFTLTVLKSMFVFLTRGAMAGALSLGGGLLAVLAMSLLYGPKRKVSLFMLSAVSAILHNLGQLMVLGFLMRSVYTLYYLPILLVSGLIMGSLTACCLKAAAPALKRLGYWDPVDPHK